MKRKIIIGVIVIILSLISIMIYMNLFFWGSFRFIGSINVPEAPNVKVAFYQENEFDHSTGVYVEIFKDTIALHNMCLLLGSGDYMYLKHFSVGMIDSVIYITAFREADVYELFDLRKNTTLIGCTERYNADSTYLVLQREKTMSALKKLNSNFIDKRE